MTVLEKIAAIIAKIEPHEPPSDDWYPIDEGSYDDAYQRGIQHGEAMLADQIREILQDKT